LRTLAALDAWKRRLGEAGVALSEEDHGDQRSIYFNDPSGIVLEITAPPSPALSGAHADALGVIDAWLSLPA
jgi:catechol-2,3-dioxygenase